MDPKRSVYLGHDNYISLYQRGDGDFVFASGQVLFHLYFFRRHDRRQRRPDSHNGGNHFLARKCQSKICTGVASQIKVIL